MVKVNSSSGGCGLFECNDETKVRELKAEIFNLPLLVQKKSMVQK